MPANFAAELLQTTAGLRLLGTQSAGQTLTMQFEANKPGLYEGNLLVPRQRGTLDQGFGSPLSLLDRISSTRPGAAQDARLDLGAKPANSGTAQVTLRIPSLDADEAGYSVEARDLAGAATVVPLRATPVEVRPTKTAPADLTLAMDVRNVPAGAYQGAIILKHGAARTVLLGKPTSA